MAWLRRERLDDEQLARLGLLPGERVLAFGHDPDRRAVVATDRSLLLQRTPPDYSRYDWHEVERASFADDVLTVRLAASPPAGATRLRVPLADAGRLPEVVRDRVTASVLLDQHVPLRGKAGVRVVARRRPAGDVLAWGYVVDEGLTLTAEEQEAAEAALAAVRAEYG
jgi:hypothetical protein